MIIQELQFELETWSRFRSFVEVADKVQTKTKAAHDRREKTDSAQKKMKTQEFQMHFGDISLYWSWKLQLLKELGSSDDFYVQIDKDRLERKQASARNDWNNGRKEELD